MNADDDMIVRNVEVENDESEDEEQMPDNHHRLPIESLDHYIAQHGIEDVPYGSQSERNLAERRHKLQEESDYQEDVHRSIFGAEEPPEDDTERRQFLARILEESIDIETSKEVIRDVPLKPMAESCETLFTLASFRQSYQEKEGNKRLSFSLKSFQHEAVVEFVAIMLGDKRPEEVSADYVVECCEIARYMQCERVLETMVDILMRSIDNANCVSLCQLADQLDLPRLFERSMAQMLQSVGSLQEHELWDDFNPELKSRIVAIESAMRSSIHANVSLYFSSMDEYLSIFAENVQYYRERLAEAKERQAEEEPNGHAWQDAEAKIAKQETRMRTLEVVLKEQKELFGRGAQRRHSRSPHSDRRP